MKKILTAFLLLAVTGLVACQSDDNENIQDNNTQVEDNENNTDNQLNDDQNNNENKADMDDDSDNNAHNNENNPDMNNNSDNNDNNNEEASIENDSSEMEEFDEYDTIQDEADIEDLKADVVEDNSNKRIILFKDNDQKVYKSIFIKNKNRLKIIDIQDDEGQIYNDEID